MTFSLFRSTVPPISLLKLKLFNFHIFYISWTFLYRLFEIFPKICSVFGWKPVVWLLQRQYGKPSHVNSCFRLSTVGGGQLWAEIAVNFLTLFIPFLHTLCLSYLLLLWLHPPSIFPLLLKRLSSGMRWRSYRPLAARLLNCQQLWRECLTETLNHSVCIAAKELTGRMIKWKNTFS